MGGITGTINKYDVMSEFRFRGREYGFEGIYAFLLLIISSSLRIIFFICSASIVYVFYLNASLYSNDDDSDIVEAFHFRRKYQHLNISLHLSIGPITILKSIMKIMRCRQARLDELLNFCA